MTPAALKQPAAPADYQSGTRPAWIQQLVSKRITSHLILWTLLYVINAISIGYLSGALHENIACFTLRVPFIIAACYLNLYFLLPNYYYKRRLLSYLSVVFLTAMVFNVLNLLLFITLLLNKWIPVNFEPSARVTAASFVYKGFFMMAMIGLTSGIKLSKDHFVQKQKAEAIEKEKLATELSLLKSQIQPHFFFNTLNNLYALTIKKSDLAPEVVLKLSELMSYVLYETEHERTSLLKEIAYIKSYIDLESLRFGRQLDVDFEINGDCDQVMLPPLLLLPFIENSFKHSMQSIGPMVRIAISLTLTGNGLSLLVANPCGETPPNTKGIGLRNVRRRLELIYDTNYSLTQERTHNRFTTHLYLVLS
ncbi:sensor histidine kinase [Hymenobacter terrenus]|uniref:sensor histidine kinase n=1 Tax=Hymenobacter terrenus TaxID=1629124 RepID=UPI000695B8C2|nr:histidine kinase [Hymenobacter terrenus]